MRWRHLVVLLALFALGESRARSAEGRVRKVLMHFLDLKGRNSLHPSLYDRDAYQAFLRKNPKEISGVRFDVEWTSDSAHRTGLRLKVEIRSIHTPAGEAPSDAFRTLAMETPVHRHPVLPGWSSVTLDGGRYKEFGDVTAWRATLWDGDRLVSEQKSFLW